jgi:hypothetical protein
MTRKFLALGAGLVLSASAFGQALQVDPALPNYTAAPAFPAT